MSQLTDNLYSIDAIKSDIKSAIEAKGVDMTGLSFPDYPAAIGSISGGGGGFTEKDITERAFAIVNLTNSASFVASYAFTWYNVLQTVDLSQCLVINNYAFSRCLNLITVSAPNVTSIKDGAFRQCSNLQSVYLPLCSYIGVETFVDCIQLQSVYLPVCSQIGGYVFSGCSALQTISLQSCMTLGNGAFQKCTGLQDVVFSNIQSISNYTFSGCTNLSTITITTSDVVCTLGGSNVFTNTNSTFSVFVPSTLLADYQSAQYWSDISAQIFSIPE